MRYDSLYSQHHISSKDTRNEWRHYQAYDSFFLSFSLSWENLNVTKYWYKNKSIASSTEIADFMSWAILLTSHKLSLFCCSFERRMAQWVSNFRIHPCDCLCQISSIFSHLLLGHKEVENSNDMQFVGKRIFFYWFDVLSWWLVQLTDKKDDVDNLEHNETEVCAF